MDALYGTHVFLMVGDPVAVSAEILRKNNLVWEIQGGYAAETITAECEGGIIVSYVWMPSWCFEDRNMEVLAHELYHVMSGIYERVGAKMDTSNQEPHAYFLGMLVSNSLVVLRGVPKRYRG